MPADVKMPRYAAVDLRERLSTMSHLAKMARELKENATGGEKVERLTDGLLDAALHAVEIMGNDGYETAAQYVTHEEDE